MSNSRILKNSAFLYLRLLFTLALGLFTTRIVINALGVEDYGLYGVVAGLITMFGFMNAAMSSSTQRYLSFDLGKKDTVQVQKTFTTSINIHVGIAVVSLILAEIIGVWAINNVLEIPPERLQAANVVFQFSLGVFALGIIQVPYHAAIIAYEQMNAYTYISIMEAVLKLSAAYILYSSPFDKLILYSQLLLVASSIVFFSYFIYVNKHYKELRYVKYFNKEYYKEILSFSGWNLFGNIAAVARNQGVNILINIFFGVALNAAYSVAMMIQGVVTQFATSIQQAINPQIIKSYAQNDKSRTEALMHASSKYSFFVVLLLVTPFYLNIDAVLNLWLGTVPEHSSLFISYIFIFLLIEVLSNSLMIGLQATGDIKKYHITVGMLVFLNFPLTWVGFVALPYPQLAFQVMILISILSLLARLIFVKRQMGYKAHMFFLNVILKIGQVLIFFIPSVLTIKYISYENILLKIISDTLLSTFMLLPIIYFSGMNKVEKKYLMKFVKSKVNYGSN